MNKLLTITIAVLISLVVVVAARAEQQNNTANPEPADQQLDAAAQQAIQKNQASPNKSAISKRNKAKLDLEAQRRQRQAEIDKERAATTDQSQQ